MVDKEGLEKRLEELKEEYSKTKDNKATNKAVGALRHKMAEIKKVISTSRNAKGAGFFVKKSGDATVALVGFPSVGKSSLINVLTNTKSKIGAYDFTTTTIIPGTMVYHEAHIQVFDMPGIIEGAHIGLGGGKSVIGAMRVSDLVVFVIDVNNINHLGILLGELKALGVRINERRPKLRIIETGLNKNIEFEVNKSGIDDAYLREVLSSLGMYGAKVKIEERVGIDDIIAIVTGNAHYMKAIVVLNKIDTNKDYERVAKKLSELYKIEVIPVSATQNRNIDALKDCIYRNLDIITVYLKPRTEDEQKMPVILRRNSKVIDAAKKLHTELADELKSAIVTGPSSKFGKQRVGSEHVLKDGDVITFIKIK
jgi:uncharacterized protein